MALAGNSDEDVYFRTDFIGARLPRLIRLREELIIPIGPKQHGKREYQFASKLVIIIIATFKTLK